MISWIQRTFQHHFKLVFILLLAVMVIPLVFIYSASGGIGNDPRRGQKVQLFGHTFNAGPERESLERHAQASSRINGNQIMGSLEGRAALRYLADKFGIPQPTEEQFKAFIQTMPLFQGANGQFDAQRYTMIVDSMRTGAVLGMSEAQVHQVLFEDCRLAQVEKALFGPGFAADADVKRAFDGRETMWSVDAATIDLSSIQTSAEPTEADLRRYFEASPAQFEIPERVQVDYVEYNTADFLAGIEPPRDEDIIAYFERNKGGYSKPPAPPAADGTTPPATETTLADVRVKVIIVLTRSRAAAKATRAAAVFAAAAVDEETKPGTPGFDALVAKNGLTIKSAPPFAERELPAGLAWTPSITTAAFRLSETNPVSDALRAGESAVVLIYRGRLEKAPASFESVRDRVAVEVRKTMRTAAISARGTELERQLAAAVAAGKPFAEAAKAAGMEVKSWEKFKRSAPPEDLDYAVYQNLATLKERTVSQAQIMGERCLIVFVNARVTPDPTLAAAEYATARTESMADAARMAGSIALVEAIKAEKIRAGLDRAEDETP